MSEALQIIHERYEEAGEDDAEVVIGLLELSIVEDNLLASADLLGEMREAINELMVWIDNWDVPFTEDDDWPNTRARIDAILAKTKEKQ